MKNIMRFERMESWMNEKTLMALKETASLVDLVRNNEKNIDVTIYNEIMEYVDNFLEYNCKVYSLILDKETDVNGNRILKFGNEGLEETLFELGLQNKTKLRTQILQLEEFINEIIILIKGVRTNRTLVHEALIKYTARCNQIKLQLEKLDEYIEDVTMAKREWDGFVEFTRVIMPDLNNTLNELKKRQEKILRG
jgi:hypothetical protein